MKVEGVAGFAEVSGRLFPFFNIPLGTDDIQIIQRTSVMPFLIVGNDSKTASTGAFKMHCFVSVLVLGRSVPMSTTTNTSNKRPLNIMYNTFFTFYLIIIHFPAFVEPSCFMSPCLVIFSM
ncbi:hypothetical protein [Tannerella forsythia]|uniref:hypothetical protein n=1 Tax=Tannerella forsythia TaxID=28112 RepID=UPI0015CF6562|nr:hypothetical protein [Tannerella forsythia]